jgi:predicted NAD/FAD-binding protein
MDITTSNDNFWSRRQVLMALAATAGLPVLKAASGPMRTVGIVGGGMAGVALAWLLDGKRKVVLLEAAAALGGNVQSVPVDLDGQSFVVDIGAQYFNPALYPTYVKLLKLLGLEPEIHSFSTTITLDEAGEGTPRFISPLLPGRAWPLVAPWNRAGLQAFTLAFEDAKKREEENADWDVTMETWLESLNLTDEQREGMLLPWSASLFSGVVDQARGMSARAAMIFVAKTLPTNPLDPILYYVLNSGMAEPLRRMIDRTSTVEVLTSAKVSAVTKEAEGGFGIKCEDGRSAHVDDLVFASSGPPTLQLIQGLPDAAGQQAALQGIEFHGAKLALHTDPIYASANPNYWSFFNAQIQGAYCEASMWLKDVLVEPPPETAAKVWKSWVTHRSQQPAQVLAQAQFQHMLPTPATLHAQNDLLALNGQGDVWFVGGYTRPYDSQETALVSAIDVAQRLLGRQ